MKRIAAFFLAIILILISFGALSEPAYRKYWGIQAMGFDLIRQSGTADGKILIAVIDSGIDTNHELFTSRISPLSRNFAGNPDDLSDIGGHGTMVAGVLAQAAPPQAELLILKVMYRDEEGSVKYADDSLFQEAILYALDQGASVINMSIDVGPTQSRITDPEHFRVWGDSIRRCREQKVPFIVSAGNSSNETAYYYPASDPNAITVSAADRTISLPRFSNYGSQIRFCAPGEDIYVPVAGTTDQYIFSSGTSLAAPFITAAAAYVRLLHPEFEVDEVCDALASCAEDPGIPGWDGYYGDGFPVICRYILQQEADYPFSPAEIIDATEGFAGEHAGNLFFSDGNKWCVEIHEGAFVEWQLYDSVCPAVIHLRTGNDNASRPGRNPSGARLYARNTGMDEWKLIWEQSPDDIMADENYRSYYFQTGITDETYRMYRLEIAHTAGDSILQLSQVEILTESPVSD